MLLGPPSRASGFGALGEGGFLVGIRGVQFFGSKNTVSCDFEWARSHAISHKSKNCGSCIGFRTRGFIFDQLSFICQGRSREKLKLFLARSARDENEKYIFLPIFYRFLGSWLPCPNWLQTNAKGRVGGFGGVVGPVTPLCTRSWPWGWAVPEACAIFL